MKEVYLLLLLLLMLEPSEARISLFSKKDPQTSEGMERKTSSGKKNRLSERGNLPFEYSRRSFFVASDNPIILPSRLGGIRRKDLNIGELVTAEISESILAFFDSKLPIRAEVVSGPLKGTIFMGEASLEKNSRRIVIEFKRLRFVNSSDVWQLAGSGLDKKGILGLEGKVISNESKYFSGELLAAAAAGYADASIQRTQNAFGNYVDIPTVDTISKKAMALALTRTADRFAEKLRTSPEYSVLEGPVIIQILITEQPRLAE